MNALAWPSAALLIAILFRRELRLALNRLGQVKYAGMELNFRDEIRRAEALAQAAFAVDPGGRPEATPRVVHEAAAGDASELPGTLLGGESSTTTTVLVAGGTRPQPHAPRSHDALVRLCHDSPRLGVMEAWDELDRAIAGAAARLGDRRPGGQADGSVRFLVGRGWLPAAHVQLVDRLRRLAVQVEQDDARPPSADEARRYLDLVTPLLDRLGGLV